MSDKPEPEPVDAEFEPASDAAPPGDAARSGVGQGTALFLFLIAAVMGGLLGFAGARLFPGPAPADSALETALAEQGAVAEGLEARLTALEAAPDASQPDLSAELTPLIARIEALEARPAGEAAAPPDLAPLEARLSALETALDAASNEDGAAESIAALTGRVQALETSLDASQAQLETALSALAEGGSEGDGEANAQLVAALGALEERVLALETAPPPSLPEVVDYGPSLETLTERLTALDRRIDALDATASQALAAARDADRAAGEAAETARSQGAGSDTARTIAARALAFTALREAATGDQPFEAERAALARLWRDRTELAALAGFSRAGAPSQADLTDTYPADAIREAAGPGRVFFGLIQVRQVEAGEDETGPLAIVALAEARLDAGDLDGAVEFTERLEGEALAAARDWLIAARARLEIDAALGAMQAALTEQAAAEGADPT